MNPFPGTESLSEQEYFSLRRYSFQKEVILQQETHGAESRGQV